MNFIYAVISTMIICAIQNVYVNGWDGEHVAAYGSLIRNLFTGYKKACENISGKKIEWNEQEGIVNELLRQADDHGNLKPGCNFTSYNKIVQEKFNVLRNKFVKDKLIDFNEVSEENKELIREVVKTYCKNVNENDRILNDYKGVNLVIRGLLRDNVYGKDLKWDITTFDNDCPCP